MKRTSKKFLMAATMLAIVSGNRVFAEDCTGSIDIKTTGCTIAIVGGNAGTLTTSTDNTGAVSFDAGDLLKFIGSIGTSSASVASISTTTFTQTGFVETLMGGNIYSTALNIKAPITLNIGAIEDGYITNIGTVSYTAAGILTLNSDTISVGQVTPTGNIGTLTFGGSGGGTVTGIIGNATNALSILNAGVASSTINLSGVSYLKTLNFTGIGTVALKAATTADTISFGSNKGFLTIDSGVTVKGNITSLKAPAQGVGTVTFNGTGTVTGNIGDSNTTHIALLDVSKGTVSVSGTIGADLISLGQYQLSLTGTNAINLLNSSITLNATSGTGYGKITSKDTITAGKTTAVTVTLPAGSEVLAGDSLTVLTSGSTGIGALSQVLTTDTAGKSIAFRQDMTNTKNLVLIASNCCTSSPIANGENCIVAMNKTANLTKSSGENSTGSVYFANPGSTGNLKLNGYVGTSGLMMTHVYTGSGDFGKADITGDLYTDALTIEGSGTLILSGSLTTNTATSIETIKYNAAGTLAIHTTEIKIGDVTTSTNGVGTLLFGKENTTDLLKISGNIGTSSLSLGSLVIDSGPYIHLYGNVYVTALTVNGQGSIHAGIGESSTKNVLGSITYTNSLTSATQPNAGLSGVHLNSINENIVGSIEYNKITAPMTTLFSDSSSNKIGTVLAKGAAKAGAGILMFVGQGTVTGDIGNSTDYLGTLTTVGGEGKIVSLEKNVYLASLNVTGKGSVSMGKSDSSTPIRITDIYYTEAGSVSVNSKDVSVGSIQYTGYNGTTTLSDSTTSVIGSVLSTSIITDASGTLVFLGSGSVTGVIGSSNSKNDGLYFEDYLALIKTNTGTVTLGSNVYSAALNLTGSGVVNVGATSKETVIGAVTYDADAFLNVNSNIATITSIDYKGKKGTTTVADSENNVIASVLSTGALKTGAGTLTFSGSGSVTGVVGTSTDYLALIQTNTGTVNLSSKVYSAALNLKDTGVVNLGAMSKETVIGAVTYDADASLNLNSDTMTIASIDYKGHAGIMRISDSTTNILQTVASTGASISGAGSLVFLGGGTVKGAVGTSTDYLELIYAGDGSVVFDKDIYVANFGIGGTDTVTASASTTSTPTVSVLTLVDYDEDGSLLLNSDIVTVGQITTTGPNIGQLTFGGTGTVTVKNGIGDADTSLSSMTIGTMDKIAPTTTINGDVYLATLNITGSASNATGAVTIGSSGDAMTTNIGALIYEADGRLNLDSSTITITGDVTTTVTQKGDLNFGGNSGTIDLQGSMGAENNILNSLTNSGGDLTVTNNVYVSGLMVNGAGTIDAGGPDTTNHIKTVTYSDAGSLNLNSDTLNSIITLNYGSHKGTTTLVKATTNTIGTITARDVGTLIFDDEGRVTGNIGQSGASLGTLTTWDGDVTLSKDAYIKVLEVKGTGTVSAGGTKTTNNFGTVTYSEPGSLSLLSDTKNTIDAINYGPKNGTTTVASATTNTIGTITAVGATKTGAGTLIFSGNGTVSGTMGDTTDYLGSIVSKGGADTVVTVQKDAYVTGVEIGAGSLTFNSDLVIIDVNGVSSTNKGTLNFGGKTSVLVVGDIGSNASYLGAVNTTTGSTAKIQLNSAFYATALNLGGTGPVTFCEEGCNTDMVVDAITYSADSVLNLNSDTVTITTLDYNNHAGITTIGKYLTSNIGSVASTGATKTGKGVLTFSESGSVGAIGTSTDYLGTLNAGASDTVTLSSHVYSAALNVTGTGTINAGGINTINRLGAVTYAAAGVLDVKSDLENTIIALNYGQNNGQTTISAATTNTIGTITATGAKKAGAGSIMFAGSGTITGPVGTATDYIGTMKVGAVGSTVTLKNANYINALNFTGTGTIALEAQTSATTLNFDAYNGTLQMKPDITLTGNITTLGTPGSGIGKIQLLGSGNLSGNVGDNASHIASLEVSNGSVRASGNIGTDGITLGTKTFIMSGTAATLDLTESKISLQAQGDVSYGNIYMSGSEGRLVTNENTTLDIDVTGYVPNDTRFIIASSDNADSNVMPLKTITIQGSEHLTFTQEVSDLENLIVIAKRPNVSNPALKNLFGLSNVPNNSELNAIIYQIDQQPYEEAVKSANKLFPEIAAQSSVQATHAAHQAARRPVYNRTVMLGSSSSSTPQETTGVSVGDDIYPYELSFLDGAEMWFKGFKTDENQQDREGSSGYKNTILGGTIGVDGHYNQQIQLGVSGAYAFSHVVLNDGINRTDINSYQWTFYGLRRFNQYFYMNGNVSLGWNQYHGSRNIVFSGVDRIAESKYTGHDYSTELGAGVPVTIMGFSVVPHTSIRYNHIEISPYSETNAGDLGLSIHRQHYDMLPGEIGVKVNTSLSLWSGMLLVPECRFERQYEFIGQAGDSRSRFVGGGDYFETQGLTPYRHSTSMGFGMELVLPHHWVWAADYYAVINPTYRAQSFIVTGRLQF